MTRHSRLGQVRVDPRTGRTTLDGELLAAPPAEEVPLSRVDPVEQPPGPVKPVPFRKVAGPA